MTWRERLTGLSIGEVIAIVSLTVGAFAAGYQVGVRVGPDCPQCPPPSAAPTTNINLYFSDADGCTPEAETQICLPVPDLPAPE